MTRRAGITVCVLLVLLILPFTHATSEFFLYEPFSSGILVNATLTNPFFPFTWVSAAPAYALSNGGVSWYVVSEQSVNNALYNQSGSTLLGVAAHVKKNNPRESLYLAYIPQERFYFGQNSRISFKCDAFSDGGFPLGYFMWTTTTNKSVFISLSNVNVGGDSGCGVLANSQYGAKQICIDTFEGICSTAHPNQALVTITFSNLTQYLVNYTNFQDIQTVGFMWLGTTGSGYNDGGVIYNFSMNAYGGTNALPSVSVNQSDPPIYYLDPNSSITIPFTVNATDAENDTIYYGSQVLIGQRQSFKASFSRNLPCFLGLCSNPYAPNTDPLSKQFQTGLCPVNLEYNASSHFYTQYPYSGTTSYVYDLYLNPQCGDASGKSPAFVYTLDQSVFNPGLDFQTYAFAGQNNKSFNLSFYDDTFNLLETWIFRMNSTNVTIVYFNITDSSTVPVFNHVFTSDLFEFVILNQASSRVPIVQNVALSSIPTFPVFTGAARYFSISPTRGSSLAIPEFTVTGFLPEISWSLIPPSTITVDQPGYYELTVYATDSYHLNTSYNYARFHMTVVLNESQVSVDQGNGMFYSNFLIRPFRTVLSKFLFDLGVSDGFYGVVWVAWLISFVMMYLSTRNFEFSLLVTNFTFLVMGLIGLASILQTIAMGLLLAFSLLPHIVRMIMPYQGGRG